MRENKKPNPPKAEGPATKEPEQSTSLPQSPATPAAAPVERAKERIAYKPGLGLVGE